MVAIERMRLLTLGVALMWLAAVPAGAEQAAQSAPPGDVAAPTQRYFASPAEAVQALLDAVSHEGSGELLHILGPELEELKSGDEVADQASRQRFIDAAAEGTDIEAEGEDYAILMLGADRWPFPIPIVKEEQGWRFDTDAGLQELLNRQIGRNELYVIAVVRAIVDAQHEYASRQRTGAGREYAQHFASSEGQRDGLYWPVSEGEEESPLGPLVVSAVKEGYRRAEDDEPQPYHGYLFRLLTAQGSHAPGGAMSYLEDGRLSKGFAVLAYPAEYGSSGIMTFIANHRGIVFQKDLGEQTEEIATAISEYDPDPAWEPVGLD
jgi:hypothetical protein